ncbi:hypothetical protein KIS4809_5549 [Bacillus sp. ZZV12-4809]|nr:hypothetical protein KIS4809_5549 [Bacillus sp. ZZV12-4809]
MESTASTIATGEEKIEIGVQEWNKAPEVALAKDPGCHFGIYSY